jgi:PAS domain S-box-containing protein
VVNQLVAHRTALALNDVHATIRTDETGRITSWDAGAEELFGHTSDAAIGQPVDIIIPEALRAAHWTGFHGAMKDPHTKDMAADLPVLCADGTIREFAGRLLALSDALGVALGAMAIYTDEGSTGRKPFSYHSEQ